MNQVIKLKDSMDPADTRKIRRASLSLSLKRNVHNGGQAGCLSNIDIYNKSVMYVFAFVSIWKGIRDNRFNPIICYCSNNKHT